MPQLTISEELHDQLLSAADDGNTEEVLWEMVGTYRRARNPQADAG